jgi:hypothetical protein
MDTATAAPAPEIEISDDAMMAAAEAADAGQPIPDSTPSTPAPETPAPSPAADESAKPTLSADEIAQREAEEAIEGKPAPKPDAKAKPESAYNKARKDSERLGKSWKDLEAEKATVRQEAERIKQERATYEQTQRELAELKARYVTPATVKDEHGIEASTYDKLAQGYDEDGDTAKAALARERAAKLRAQAPAAPAATAPAQSATEAFTTPEFQAKWREATQALVQAEPDLARADNPVVQTANALLNDKTWAPFFLSRPDGIRAAVEVAKLQQQAAKVATFEKELGSARAEIARLTKLTGLRGSMPASQIPPDRKAEDLNDAEMMAIAQAADAAGG